MNGIQSTVQHGCNNCHNCGNTNLAHNRQNQSLDPSTVVNHFLIEYYRNASNIGWNATMYLFDQQCTVMCRDKNVGNAYDFLNALSSEYIKRANYDSLRSKWMAINNNSVLINVFGHIQFVGFNSHLTNIIPFTETFVLTANNGNVSCTHHMLDF